MLTPSTHAIRMFFGPGYRVYFGEEGDRLESGTNGLDKLCLWDRTRITV
jgi:putative component of toxin-antitoxin plasmid stabilization module